MVWTHKTVLDRLSSSFECVDLKKKLLLAVVTEASTTFAEVIVRVSMGTYNAMYPASLFKQYIKF